MPRLETDEAVAANCGDCGRSFYVTEEPENCPYCDGGGVEVTHGVVVRPH